MAERSRAPGRAQGIAGTWPPRAAVQAGGYAPSGFRSWSNSVERLREWASAEVGAGRLLPWAPIAYGTGIALYFAAEHEPVLSVTLVTATALCFAAFLLRRRSLFPLAILLAAAVAGFATAT
jgi:competence protein ComEC